MKKMMTVFFLLVLFQLPASTIIINSVFNGDSDASVYESVGYIEDGLMDSLFDMGFIMFSTINAMDYRVEGAKDARYMISIEPRLEEAELSWKLNATVNGMLVDEGVVDFSAINAGGREGTQKFYYLIGEEVAAKVSRFF